MVAAWYYTAITLKGQDTRFDELFTHYQTVKQDARLRFLIEMLGKKSGIREIYEPDSNKPVIE